MRGHDTETVGHDTESTGHDTPKYPIRVDATRCVAAYFKGETKTPTNSMKESLGVTSVIAGVNAELVNLKKIRQSSRIHYSWPVPYLPFNIVESDIFYPLMSASIMSSVATRQQKETLN